MVRFSKDNRCSLCLVCALSSNHIDCDLWTEDQTRLAPALVVPLWRTAPPAGWKRLFSVSERHSLVHLLTLRLQTAEHKNWKRGETESLACSVRHLSCFQTWTLDEVWTQFSGHFKQVAGDCPCLTSYIRKVQLRSRPRVEPAGGRTSTDKS